MPDRIILAPGGRVFFVEMKRPGGKLRPLQVQNAKVFRGLGHPVSVIDSKEGIRRFIAELKNPLACSDEYRAGYNVGFLAALGGGDA